jgi:AcrR family transcriptional regulator
MAEESQNTGRRLLEAACKIFAEKGFRSATVAAICKKARANIAAVNYHFGSKENLYQQAWRHAHERLSAQIPPDGGVGDEQPPEQRLRGRIRAGLQRAMLGDAVEFRIMRNEMANPTGLLRQVIEDAIRPIRRATQALLRELLGRRATELDVALCEVCVVAPLMHVTHRRRAQQHEGLAPVFREEMLEAMVDHFTAFALAGIREARRRIEKSGGKQDQCSGRPRRKVSST